jgi:hypothetical protein
MSCDKCPVRDDCCPGGLIQACPTDTQPAQYYEQPLSQPIPVVLNIVNQYTRSNWQLHQFVDFLFTHDKNLRKSIWNYYVRNYIIRIVPFRCSNCDCTSIINRCECQYCECLSFKSIGKRTAIPIFRSQE